MHKYELEDLLDRVASIQRDVLRHLNDAPQLTQMQGMTEVLLEFRRSLGVIRVRLKRMNELPSLPESPDLRPPHRRQ